MNKPKSSSQPTSSAESNEKQRDAGNAFFKRLLTDRNKKLDELKQTQSVLEKNAPKSSKEGPTKVSVAFELLSDLIDECIYDVLTDAHRDSKRGTQICQICQTKCRGYVKRPGADIFGNSYAANNLPSYECVNCRKSIAASRYAPHLEKCLGLAGRQSSRVASRRLGSSSPFTAQSDDSMHMSDPEDKKKKRQAPPGSSPSNGISRVKKLKNSASSDRI
ncbi:hypothetical protein BCR43DRAFT_565563 [Syncephalastrum racemosum]|uniref:SAGA-associated factor 11 n=1 Tax=Syncephalastrum racemosum TaxID=13706 RepID=A0A1X2H6M6_SYNRA|nr:hypothetical protein BCR43DRAFT_565563 [Syncephalastrum racemosum]